MSANEMTGGEAMARMLKALNAGPMFGMGGFQLLAFYDAARRLKLDHHLINDERCGAFAADAYAKVSGRVGLVDATLGPGATNLATGLVEALNAGSPVVAFIGDSAHSTSPQLGQGANMALLDALALSHALASAAGLDDALEAYCRSRRWHVRVFQGLSLTFTPFYQSDGRLLPFLRDTLVATVARVPPAPRVLASMVAGTIVRPMR